MPVIPRSWPVVLLLAAVMACGGGGGDGSNPVGPQAIPPRVVAVDAAYGTLRFRGLVERREQESTYEYSARLTLTFDAYARTNSTSSIHLTSALLTATIPNLADRNGPWLQLYKDGRPVQGDFVANGETRELPELRFVLPKTIEAQAENVGLSVTDGRFMWPVPVNFKTM